MTKFARLVFASVVLCGTLTALVGASAHADTEQSAGPRFEGQSSYTVDRGEEILVYVRAVARDELGDCLLVTVSPLPEGVTLGEGNVPPCPAAGNDWAYGWDQIFFFKSFIPGVHAIHLTASYGGVTKEFTVAIDVRRIATQVVADPSIATVTAAGVSTPLMVVARLTAGTAPLVGRTVRFTTPSGAAICSGATAANGVASCNPIASAIRSVPLGYVAAFDGDTTHLPSSSRGGIVRVLSVTLP